MSSSKDWLLFLQFSNYPPWFPLEKFLTDWVEFLLEKRQKFCTGTWQTFDLKHIVEGKQQIINDEIFLQFCKLFYLFASFSPKL
jgi:hypothetical protein